MSLAGISQSELARRIGCGRGGVSVLFQEQTKISRLVAPIHEVLGMPPPTTLTVAAVDNDMRRVLEGWRLLIGEQRATIATLVEQLGSVRASASEPGAVAMPIVRHVNASKRALCSGPAVGVAPAVGGRARGGVCSELAVRQRARPRAE